MEREFSTILIFTNTPVAVVNEYFLRINQRDSRGKKTRCQEDERRIEKDLRRASFSGLVRFYCIEADKVHLQQRRHCLGSLKRLRLWRLSLLRYFRLQHVFLIPLHRDATDELQRTLSGF